MKTIISHFYNEEYLLPWWLKHHKQFFDHGIMIDYHSTDNSVNIIKEICPTWEIVESKNKEFDAADVDVEVMEIESKLDGWRIVLNTTEFLIGDFEKLSQINKPEDIIISSYVMVDNVNEEFTYPNINKSLISQRLNGFKDVGFRRGRKLSNFYSTYPLGRHYNIINTDNFIILWYGFSPMNDSIIKRKLQIQNKMPESDKQNGQGYQHITNENKIKNDFKDLQNKSYDLTINIKKYDNNNILNT